MIKTISTRAWILCLTAAALTAAIACRESKPPSTTAAAPAWRPLFDGRDFSGWYTFLKGLGKNSDPDRIFQVDDGMIHIYKDAADGSRQLFGYLCTSDEYGDCRVRLEYKWGTKRFAPRDKSRRDSGLL